MGLSFRIKRSWLVSLALFGVVELVFAGYARAASAMAHLHALQSVTVSLSAGGAAGACAEAEAALDDLAPALLPLNVARLVPLPSAQAWGEVPRLADAAQSACRSVQVYASVAPWRDTSLEQGAAADVLAAMRRQPAQMATAAANLDHALAVLNNVDLSKLSAEPRLDRVTRALGGLRAEQADVPDMLALSAPERAETLLGGSAAVAWVLELTDLPGNVVQAHMLVEHGQVLAVQAGPATVPATMVVSLDPSGWSMLASAGGGPAAPDLGAMLQRFSQNRLSDDVALLAALRTAVDQHHAWLRFADPALQAIVARHGWTQL